MAQSVERRLGKAEVGGSIPLDSFSFFSTDSLSGVFFCSNSRTTKRINTLLPSPVSIRNSLQEKTGDSVRHIPLKDIICFETSSRTHRIVLYTETERLDFINSSGHVPACNGACQYYKLHSGHAARHSSLLWERSQSSFTQESSLRWCTPMQPEPHLP